MHTICITVHACANRLPKRTTQGCSKADSIFIPVCIYMRWRRARVREQATCATHELNRRQPTAARRTGPDGPSSDDARPVFSHFRSRPTSCFWSLVSEASERGIHVKEESPIAKKSNRKRERRRIIDSVYDLIMRCIDIRNAFVTNIVRDRSFKFPGPRTCTSYILRSFFTQSNHERELERATQNLDISQYAR